MSRLFIFLVYSLFISFNLFAQTEYSQRNFEYMFPPGVEGDDWFSKKAFDGHKINVITNGADLLEARMEAIRNARRSILLSTYIYDVDATANQITDALCERARAGVDVRLLVDWLGARKFYKEKAEYLRNCGAGIIKFSPGKWDLLRVIKTMHEKLLIVDGTRVLIGGTGVQNSYHHVSPAHKFFYDMDFDIEGPIACWWHFKFVEMYNLSRRMDRPKAAMGNTAGARRLDERLYGPRQNPPCYPFKAGDSRVLPVYGNPVFYKKKTPLEDIYLEALENLEEGDTVKLYGPYFVPTKRFVKALVKAKEEKKAKISIITNSIESNDEGWAPLVGMVYSVSKLMKAGIDLRLWPGPMTLHRKVGIYGGKWGYVGSDNLDRRGQHYNTESEVFTDDAEVVAKLEQEYDQDYAQTAPLTKEYLKKILDRRSGFQRFLGRIILPFL